MFLVIQKLMPQDLHSPQNHVPTQPVAQTGISCGWRSWQKGTARPVEQRKLTCMKAFWPSISIKIFSPWQWSPRTPSTAARQTNTSDWRRHRGPSGCPAAGRTGWSRNNWGDTKLNVSVSSETSVWGSNVHILHVHVVVPRRTHHGFTICQHQTWWQRLEKSRREKVRRKEKYVTEYKYICVPCWRMRRSSGTPSALWKTF